MWVKPAWLVAGVVVVGLLLLGGVLLLSDQFGSPYGKLILTVYVAVWVLFTVGFCIPAAVIAQAARNKRYGVFSHLRQATTKEVQGGTNVAEKR
jgi:high-affinity K+ transport system ATPase subunit B